MPTGRSAFDAPNAFADGEAAIGFAAPTPNAVAFKVRGGH